MPSDRCQPSPGTSLPEEFHLVQRPRDVLSRVCDELIVRVRDRAIPGRDIQIVAMAPGGTGHDEAVTAGVVTTFCQESPRPGRRGITPCANLRQLRFAHHFSFVPPSQQRDPSLSRSTPLESFRSSPTALTARQEAATRAGTARARCLALWRAASG